MKVHLIRTHRKHDLLEKVYNLLLQEDGPAQFVRQDRRTVLQDGQVPWQAIFDSCTEFRTQQTIPTNALIILLMEQDNTANWFSCPDPNGTRSIFIHTAGWDKYLIDCDPQYPIAFQCWENLLHSLMFQSLEQGVELSHDPPIGCITDFCSWKPDITYKLRTADICGDCLALLKERDAPPALIEQALRTFERLRNQMLFSKDFRGTEDQKTKLPFSVAITRRRLSTIPGPALRKFTLLINHFDSLIRTSVIFIGAAGLKHRMQEFLAERQLLERPSLGHWVSALRTLTERGLDLETVGLPSDLSVRIRNVLTKADGLVQQRNERLAHGYVASDSEYSNVYDLWSPAVMEIEKSLTPALIRLSCCQWVEILPPVCNQYAVMTARGALLELYVGV